jgi:hypothetical protein
VTTVFRTVLSVVDTSLIQIGDRVGLLQHLFYCYTKSGLNTPFLRKLGELGELGELGKLGKLPEKNPKI